MNKHASFIFPSSMITNRCPFCIPLAVIFQGTFHIHLFLHSHGSLVVARSLQAIMTRSDIVMERRSSYLWMSLGYGVPYHWIHLTAQISWFTLVHLRRFTTSDGAWNIATQTRVIPWWLAWIPMTLMFRNEVIGSRRNWATKDHDAFPEILPLISWILKAQELPSVV